VTQNTDHDHDYEDGEEDPVAERWIQEQRLRRRCHYDELDGRRIPEGCSPDGVGFAGFRNPKKRKNSPQMHPLERNLYPAPIFSVYTIRSLPGIHILHYSPLNSSINACPASPGGLIIGALCAFRPG
jgi:hypothetical protein